MAQIGTLPETRRALLSPDTRRHVRSAASRVAHDRARLARDLTRPADIAAFARSAFAHPATRELAGAGMLFMPGRYLPIGWAAGWAGRRIARRIRRRATAP
ncbi:MAG: hypothetical protein ACRDGI_11340 [Candidatus Limnocylindrales bacterium]